MTGTWLNIATVLIGGMIGLRFGAYPERARSTVIAGLGLFTAAIGLKCLWITNGSSCRSLLGGLLGDWGRIEDRLRGVGAVLEKRFMKREPVESQESSGRLIGLNSRFVQGFLTASLVFCVGPMTILGSIQDGLTGNYQLLAIKSVLDGFASLAFASTLGIGVLFSTLVICYTREAYLCWPRRRWLHRR
jgi:uncharacterized membrane protein YqgA involved in biofilm formation